MPPSRKYKKYCQIQKDIKKKELDLINYEKMYRIVNKMQIRSIIEGEAGILNFTNIYKSSLNKPSIRPMSHYQVYDTQDDLVFRIQ